jgi:uncharacterized membrane protein YebE (DUF533 family)
MNEPVAAVARASAQQLTDKYGPRLPTDVEAALHATDGRPQQYTDPVAIGSLIVSIAALAWTVYWNLKQGTPKPAPQIIIRTVRIEAPATIDLETAERDRIIEAVVTEAIAHAETRAPALGDGQSEAK